MSAPRNPGRLRLLALAGALPLLMGAGPSGSANTSFQIAQAAVYSPPGVGAGPVAGAPAGPTGGGAGHGGGGGGGGGFSPSIGFSITLGGRPSAPKPAPPEPPSGPDERSADTVVFLLRQGGPDPRTLARSAGLNLVEATPLQSVQLVMAVAGLAPGDTPEAAVARLSKLPGVAWAQVDHLYQALGAAAPPGFELEGLTGEAMATPAPGVVAMIDTALAANHEVFAGATIEQRLFATPMTAGAHGTAVAALLVGGGDTPGTGRGAHLVDLAAFEQSDPDAPAKSQTRYLAKALDAAVLLRPNVLNLSFGGPGDRLLETLLSAVDAKGVCIVAAAGNGGKAGRPPFPASHPAVLGVTAVDSQLRIYEAATPGPQVDVAAMGVDLVLATPGGYRQMSGTSFATAVVSGALLRLPACARARNPAAMRAAVAAAARDLGAPGRDDVFGAGLFRLPPSALR